MQQGAWLREVVRCTLPREGPGPRPASWVLVPAGSALPCGSPWELGGHSLWPCLRPWWCSLQLKGKWEESIFTKGCIPALEGWLPRNIYIVAGVFIAISLLQVCPPSVAHSPVWVGPGSSHERHWWLRGQQGLGWMGWLRPGEGFGAGGQEFSEAGTWAVPLRALLWVGDAVLCGGPHG